MSRTALGSKVALFLSMLRARQRAKEAVMDATTQLLISTYKCFVREADDNLISEVVLISYGKSRRLHHVF